MQSATPRSSSSITPPRVSSTSSLPSPPDSTEKAAPLPARLSPVVGHAVRLVREHREGHRPVESWVKFSLEDSDYVSFIQQLQFEGLFDYLEDKVRHDYDPTTHTLIFRMTTPTLDIFTSKVVDEIRSQLRGISSSTSNPLLATLASSILFRSTSRIVLAGDPTDDNKYPFKSPDAAFTLVDSNYPSVILETSFSQKRKDLSRLAVDYIVGSVANVSVVVGLDIEYRNNKAATVSVWRPREGINADGKPFLEVDQVVRSEPFRLEDGHAAEGCLRLLFADFFPTDALENLPTTLTLPDIELPFPQLAGFLSVAEAHHQISETKTGKGRQRFPDGIVLPKRPLSPEEAMGDADEEKFLQAEEQADKTANRGDERWCSRKRGKGKKASR